MQDTTIIASVVDESVDGTWPIFEENLNTAGASDAGHTVSIWNAEY
jgi:hypothetical protein